MTSRRRFIGAMTALGIMPTSALAQDTTDTQRYQCKTSFTEGQQIIEARARGTKTGSLAMHGSLYQDVKATSVTLGKDTALSSLTVPGKLSLVFSRVSKDNLKLIPANLTLEIKEVFFGGRLEKSEPCFICSEEQRAKEANAKPNRYVASEEKDLKATFYSLSGEEILSTSATLGKIEQSSTAPVEKRGRKLGRKLTINLRENLRNGDAPLSDYARLQIQSHVDRIMAENGRIIVAINHKNQGWARKDAILTWTCDGWSSQSLLEKMTANVDIVVKKHMAGECPELKGCFLTTASSQALGLADDCWELETLRAFRDGPLQTLPSGPELIERYYLEAPEIVSSIPLAENRKLWAKAWLFGVLPAAIFCKFKAHRAALWIYRRLFESLSVSSAGQKMP